MSKNQFDPIKVSLGNLISTKRKCCGYSQEEFAYTIGISARALSDIETGKSYPNLDHAAFISDVLDIPLINHVIELSDDPIIVFNFQYREFEKALSHNSINEMVEILDFMELIIGQLDKNSIYYKKYLLSKARVYELQRDIHNSIHYLKLANNLVLMNRTEEEKILNYRIFLSYHTLLPDTYADNLDLLKKTAEESVFNLKSKFDELNTYPDIKLKYLFNTMLIELENLKDYKSANHTLNQALILANKIDNTNVIYKCYAFRGIIKYHTNDSSYMADINDSLEFFHTTNQEMLYNSFAKIVKKNTLRPIDD